ncbi:MAG TPA: hypothetical protein VMF06_24740 [Candidatus Limnocylindria bacterium]|jgi:hypothetical protein|nr:hypothetical protein [Candidatus Limnocylindria bacterium]
MGKIIELPNLRREASPHLQYLRRQKRDARTDLALFGLMATCGMVALLISLVKFSTSDDGGMAHQPEIRPVPAVQTNMEAVAGMDSVPDHKQS